MQGPHFDGETYEPREDHARLTSQLERVKAAMSDRQWWTLEQLVTRCGGTTASVSARVRDLRKAKFGEFTVARRRVDGGLFEYSLSAAQAPPIPAATPAPRPPRRPMKAKPAPKPERRPRRRRTPQQGNLFA